MEVELLAAKDAVADGEDAAIERLEVAKEEYQLTKIVQRSMYEFYLNQELQQVVNVNLSKGESSRCTPWADKARATPTTRSRASKKNPIYGHGDNIAARRPQALARLPLPPAPPAALPFPRPAALPAPAAWGGGGVHGAGPELAGGHPGAHRRGPPRGGPRGAHPERRRRCRRRHRRLRRVPPPRQQEVHRHGFPGLLRLQRPPRQGGRPVLRSALLLVGRHWRRAAENRGDPGRRGPAPHVQRHRVRGGDLPRHDEDGKGETGEVEEPGAGDTDGGAGGEGAGGHLRVLLRAGHGGAGGREAAVHDAERGVPVGGEAGGGEDGVHHGERGGLWRAEGPRRQGRAQGGGAAAAQGPRVPQAEQAGLDMKRGTSFLAERCYIHGLSRSVYGLVSIFGR